MAFGSWFKRKNPDEATKAAQEAEQFYAVLCDKVRLDREHYAAMGQETFGELIRESRALYGQGLAADQAGEYEVAKQLYRAAYEISPFNIEALDNHGILLIEEWRFKEAIPLFERSIVADPSSPVAIRCLIRCYQAADEHKLAWGATQLHVAQYPGESPFIDLSAFKRSRNPLQQKSPEQKFQPGAVWTYKTRPGEKDSRIWVRFVERFGDNETAVHVSITNVRITGRSEPMFVSHMPFQERALSECVIEIADEKQTWTGEHDHFGEGFYMWFDAFEQGQAGLFTIPVHEALEAIDQPQGST